MIKKYQSLLLIVGITVLVFLLTRNPISGPYRLHLAVLSLIVFFVLLWQSKKKKTLKVTNTMLVFCGTTTLLFIVAATGWFLSPFFYLLYLLPIFFSFRFSTHEAYGFVITLAVLFAFTIGQIDVLFDVLVLLSFLSVIPLIRYLKSHHKYSF